MSSHLQEEHMPGLGGTDTASVAHNLPERIDLNLSICLQLAILRIHLWVYKWDQLRMTEQSIRKTITYISAGHILWYRICRICGHFCYCLSFLFNKDSLISSGFPSLCPTLFLPCTVKLSVRLLFQNAVTTTWSLLMPLFKIPSLRTQLIP